MTINGSDLVAERDRQALVCAVLVSQGHWDQATERAQIVSNLSRAVEWAATQMQEATH